jgi:hypothetical protein
MRHVGSKDAWRFPFRVSVVRVPPAKGGTRGTVGGLPIRHLFTICLAAAPLLTVPLIMGMGGPAQAASSGSSTATVNIATRSVTVTPSSLTFDSCSDNNTNSTGTYLTYPNGDCLTTGTVTVTNGNQPSHIGVSGADAIPADNGTHWTLCGGNGTGCTNSGFPGQDQFGEQGHSPSGSSPYLTSLPQCDTSFSAACAATAGQGNSLIRLELIGPSASTDPSLSFSTVWTWTAFP